MLIDGTPPAAPDDLLARLEELGIACRTRSHPPVFTVEQAKALRGEIPGAHTKNLFVRDKKGAMWLVVALEDRAIDLKALHVILGTKRLSFGSPRRLMEYLGVVPGAVTPFAVINDHGGHVRVALDRGLLAFELWSFHPLDNHMTTTLEGAALIRFLEAEAHPPVFVDFGTPGD